MTSNKVSVALINQYFDLSSFGDEIKPYIDDSVFIEIESGTRKMMNVFVQKNAAILKDDFI